MKRPWPGKAGSKPAPAPKQPKRPTAIEGRAVFLPAPGADIDYRTIKVEPHP